MHESFMCVDRANADKIEIHQLGGVSKGVFMEDSTFSTL